MISEDIPSESNAVQINAPSVSFFIVTPSFIIFRFWRRVARRSNLGWDDITIIISFSSALTVQIVMVVSCSYGFGRHIETLTTDDKLMALKISQLPVAHKRALMMVLTMGGVTSIVRMTTLDLATKTLDTTFDISSTMWTIIEQNSAIICTRLPMCRIHIAIILPSCFPNSKKSSRSVSQRSDGSRIQTGAWNPYVGPRSAQGLTRSVVLPNDEASEEVILGTLERSDSPSTLASAAGVIRKTVEYGVTYEINPEANP
ncbi:integral membrane protein [Fusarium sp. NRRL 52700]|nr:integral membrane protein [Fusarium sp. NRRL 52700]